MKIKVKIHPNSSLEKVVELGDKNLEVWVKETPLEGKANLALEKILKKHFKKPVKIIFGFKSRKKVIEVEDDI